MHEKIARIVTHPDHDSSESIQPVRVLPFNKIMQLRFSQQQKCKINRRICNVPDVGLEASTDAVAEVPVPGMRERDREKCKDGWKGYLVGNGTRGLTAARVPKKI